MFPLEGEDRVGFLNTHPAAQHVQDAQRYFEEGNARECDRAYRRAVEGTWDVPWVRCALMEDHLGRLMEFGWYQEAASLCADYLRRHPENAGSLKLLELEIRSLQGQYAPDFEDVVMFIVGAGRVSGQRKARLTRIIGLREAAHGTLPTALRYLEGSLRLCREFDPENVGRLIEDITHFRALTGEGDLPPDDDDPRTPVDHLRHAERLRLSGYYQRAERAATTALRLSGRDASLQWAALCELVRALWGQRRPDAVEALRPLLEEAAGRTPDPAQAGHELRRVLERGATDGPVRTNFEQRVQDARRLLGDGHPDEAEAELTDLLQDVGTPREVALWHLAKAECGWWRYRARHEFPFLADCARHAARAVLYAQTGITRQVRIAALRLLADALTKSGAVDADDYAVECWAEAHRLEELTANLQDDDEIRVRMLLPVPDEHDKRVSTALRRVLELQAPHGFGITVAMEAARGALILPRILPAETERVRTLPGPTDWQGARDWLAQMSAALPRNQAAWLVHATEDRLIQSLVLPGGTYHHYVDLDRDVLAEAIDMLAYCWDDLPTLKMAVSGGHFNRQTKALARLLAIDDVLDPLPRRIQRLAIIAGNEVSEIPFAALPLRETGEPLGLRYALSDLPCLSALDPLRRRAADRRGDALLLVRPDGTKLEHGERRMPPHEPLDGPLATAAGLRTRLARRCDRIVRIDTHGVHDPDHPEASLVQMSPDGDDGWLRCDEFETMDLEHCGTLVLGACETGMVRRIGRDERRGFVRSAFNAGAPAVLAARWLARNEVAAALLDRFHWHVGYLPRDLALRSAIRDVQGITSEAADWACWTLYGDSGLQTDAGARLRRNRRARIA